MADCSEFIVSDLVKLNWILPFCRSFGRTVPGQDELLIQNTICEYFTFGVNSIEVIFMTSLNQEVYEENTLKEKIQA